MSVAGDSELDTQAVGGPGLPRDLLRCIGCKGPVAVAATIDPPGYPDLGPDGVLECATCGRRYPLVAGTARMLAREHAGSLRGTYPRSHRALAACGVPVAAHAHAGVKQRTAASFAYEWEHFGALRHEWSKNFRDYMRPHAPEQLRGKLILDVGAGSGRHSYHAHEHGARVVAVDLSASIDVARRNLPADVLTVQADAEDLPFDPDSFDLVMSIGVLHHLPDPGRALRAIARYIRPGGHLQVYLYWVPPWGWHQRVLKFVSAVRTVTVRLPHRVLHLLCYPLAAVLFAFVVLPYSRMRKVMRLQPLAERLPLKTYADYPFTVCVNDQFDRLSAPLERRYRPEEVDRLLASAGLEERQVIENHGWLGSARRPLATAVAD